MTPANAPKTYVSGDRPIADPAEDLLGFAPYAQHSVERMVTMAPADGFVVGIYGAWGSRKTTLRRFIAHYLDQQPEQHRPVIVHFNPWWFSGNEELTRHFLGELRSTLSKWREISDEVLERIGDLAQVLSEDRLTPRRPQCTRSESDYRQSTAEGEATGCDHSSR